MNFIHNIFTKECNLNILANRTDKTELFLKKNIEYIQENYNQPDNQKYVIILLKNSCFNNESVSYARGIIYKKKKSSGSIENYVYKKFLKQIVNDNISPNFLKYYGNDIWSGQKLNEINKKLKMDNNLSYNLFLTENLENTKTLNTHLETLMETELLNQEYFTPILFQIIYACYVLATNGINHNNLSFDNIIIHKTHSRIFQFNISESEYIFQTSFVVYFVNFGNACVENGKINSELSGETFGISNNRFHPMKDILKVLYSLKKSSLFSDNYIGDIFSTIPLMQNILECIFQNQSHNMFMTYLEYTSPLYILKRVGNSLKNVGSGNSEIFISPKNNIQSRRIDYNFLKKSWDRFLLISPSFDKCYKIQTGEYTKTYTETFSKKYKGGKEKARGKIWEDIQKERKKKIFVDNKFVRKTPKNISQKKYDKQKCKAAFSDENSDEEFPCSNKKKSVLTFHPDKNPECRELAAEKFNNWISRCKN